MLRGLLGLYPIYLSSVPPSTYITGMGVLITCERGCVSIYVSARAMYTYTSRHLRLSSSLSTLTLYIYIYICLLCHVVCIYLYMCAPGRELRCKERDSDIYLTLQLLPENPNKPDNLDENGGNLALAGNIQNYNTKLKTKIRRKTRHPVSLYNPDNPPITL